MAEKIYDLIIIGAGPAGLSASIYASRYKLSHLVLGAIPGGQMEYIHQIENYPGFASISGKELIDKFVQHARGLGGEIKNESVSAINKISEHEWEIETAGEKYQTKSIILAMGAERRQMNIPGEKEFVGKGVSYCATCDAMFFTNKKVVVIGGGNSAAVAAIQTADHAEKVYLVFPREEMKAEPYWQDKMLANPKIELVKATRVLEIQGENKVEKVMLDKNYQENNFIETDGVFIEIGSDPGITLANQLGVVKDEQNYLIVDGGQSTNIEGIYAAGDITTGLNKFRQVLTACAEGANASNSVYRYLKLK